MAAAVATPTARCAAVVDLPAGHNSVVKSDPRPRLCSRRAAAGAAFPARATL